MNEDKALRIWLFGWAVIGIGAVTFLLSGCGSTPDPHNDIANERLGSIDNHLSDISASLKKIADRPHIFPLGDEKK